MKKITLLFCFAAAITAMAGGRGIVFTTGFDSPDDMKVWKQHPHFTHAPGAGRSGTGAALISRDSFNGELITMPLSGLDENKVYRLTVWSRPEKITSKSNNNYGACYIAMTKGARVYRSYPLPSNLKKEEWQQQSFEFSIKPGLDKIELVLWLRDGFKGKVFIDDIVLEEAGDTHAAILIASPNQLTFFGDRGLLKINASVSKPEPLTLDLKFTNGKTVKNFTLKELTPGRFEIQLDELTPGGAVLEMILRGPDGKEITSSTQKMFVHAKGKAVRHFDQYGRMIVYGKPFMPIGIYGGVRDAGDIKRIQAAGFNTVMQYASIGMRLNGWGKNQIQTMRKSLDLFHAHKLKVIFNLKEQYINRRAKREKLDHVKGLDNVTRHLVSSLRYHPAIIGWYVSDEHTRPEIPRMLKMRQLISEIDPYHPTVTLTYRSEDMPLYGVTGDVLAVDNYPIGKKDVPRNISSIFEICRIASMAGQPVWFVPQIFNWGACRAKDAEDFKTFRFPEEKEMKAMILAGAVEGAKGFLLYSYMDVIHRSAKYAPESIEPQWQRICNSVQLLKTFQPFIMSAHKIEKVIDNGSEVVAVFRNDRNKRAVVAISCKDGQSALVLPAGAEFIRLDGAAEFKDGKWIFTGKDVDFAVLVEK